MFQLFKNTQIDFIGLKRRRFAFTTSLIFIIIGIVSLIIKGPQYSIDFAGGFALRLKFSKNFSIEEIRNTLKKIDLADSIIQKFGKEKDEVLIRVKQTEDLSLKIQSVLKEKFDSLQKKTNKKDLNEVTTSLELEKELKKIGFLNSNLKNLAFQIIKYRDVQGGLIKDFDELTKIEGINIDKETLEKIKERFYLGSFILRSIQKIGPAVSKDIQWKTIVALILTMMGILAYVGFRFKFEFALAADIALLHDILVTLAALSLANKEISIPVVASLLTIVGYSVNDTIVIFDRIRENLKIYRNEPYESIINKSINETLSRTIITSFTTLLAVISLFFFGGEVLHDFAFALLVGITVGTYSSIYIASSFLIEWKYLKSKKKR